MKRLTSILLAIVMCMTLIVPAFASGSLTFNDPTPEYQKKAFIHDTNACLVMRFQKPKGSKYTASGIRLMDETGKVIADHKEKVTNVGKNTTSFHVWFDINKELNVTLTPATKYVYNFYGEMDGKLFYGPFVSFTTTGNPPLYTVDLDAAGGVVRPLSIQLHTGDVFGELPVPVRGGYEFSYWSLNGKRVTPDTVFDLKSNATLEARWIELTIPDKIPDPTVDPDIPEPPVTPEPTVPPVVPETPDQPAMAPIHIKGRIGRDHSITVDPEHRGVAVQVSKDTDQLLSEGCIVINDASGKEIVRVGSQPDDRKSSRLTFQFQLDSEEILNKLDSLSRGECYFAFTINGKERKSEKRPFVNGFYGLPRINSTFWVNRDHTGGSYVNVQFPGRKYTIPPTFLVLPAGIRFDSWGTRDGREVTNDTIVQSYTDMDFYAWTVNAGSTGFNDVKPTDWFNSSVSWAVQNRIADGVGNGNFAPNAKCTTAQILTFLWNASGRPVPYVSDVFKDVKSSDWFNRASLWSYQVNLVDGQYFNGSANCTRADVVTYFWRLSGCPDAPVSHFPDVSRSADYARAVDWAYANHVTSGYGDGRFGPGDTCTRAQITTFLQNYSKIK